MHLLRERGVSEFSVNYFSIEGRLTVHSGGYFFSIGTYFNRKVMVQ